MKPDQKDIDRRAEDIIGEARFIIESVAGVHFNRWGPDALGSQPEDPDADVREKAIEWLTWFTLENPDAMPGDVELYFLHLLVHAPRGPINKRTRDKILAKAVSDVCYLFGLTPTRNSAKHGSREDLSGCGAVAMALAGQNISEAALEKIWQAEKNSVIPFVPEVVAKEIEEKRREAEEYSRRLEAIQRAAVRKK
jgi:hypothetical protein